MEVFRRIHVYCTHKNDFGRKCSDGSKYDWLWVFLSQTVRFHWFSLNYLFLPLFINLSLFFFPFYFPLSLTSPFIISLLFMISGLSLPLSPFPLFQSASFCLLPLNFLQHFISFSSVSLFFQRREIFLFSSPFSYSVYCTKLIPLGKLRNAYVQGD